MITLVPAYGRDYKSGKEVQKDWDAGKDFIISDAFNPYDGKPANKRSFQVGEVVGIRYKRLTQIKVIKVVKHEVPAKQ